MTVGERAGATYPLCESEENLIGRGTECTVTLTDPRCSRVHAVVARDTAGAWHVRDAESRNGTLVNGQRADEARLDEGHTIQVGATQLAFHQSEQPPTANGEVDLGVTQTVVKDTPITGVAASIEAQAERGADQTDQLRVLYQLSIQLLGCESPDEVIRTSLEWLHERTKAEVVGFLWRSDEGELKPKLVIPDELREKVTLSKSLTELVSQQGHAIWIANQSSASATESLEHFADAVCVPLVSDGETLGAIHVYLQLGRFRQSDFDFVISVAHVVTIALVRARSHSSLQTSFQRLVEGTPGYDDLVGECEPMRQLKSRAAKVAKASGCVMIRGESGSGKELVARYVHRASPRADRPMLSVNCAAIPADLMESQLFGHKAGAFTGADRDHEGYFQQADLGTLFLDEVGELTLEGQAKLLRILEGHPFLPVGATEEVSVDVRVIAATNQELQTYVREKRFREDLYYRLSVFELIVPPLRERGEDINLLIDFFLAHFRNHHGRPGLEMSDEARNKLLGYQWPGNVRQLRNVIDSAVVLAEGSRIETDDLGLRDSGAGELETLSLEHWERKLIREALRRTSGNIPEAAKLLGIGRATIYRKIEQYGIAK